MKWFGSADMSDDFCAFAKFAFPKPSAYAGESKGKSILKSPPWLATIRIVTPLCQMAYEIVPSLWIFLAKEFLCLLGKGGFER
jgi:hypothetical protein